METLFKEDGWMTLENIAQKLRCSKRILRDDIN
ncbi:helix-turn-helix domain-containing protein [Bacillus cereus]|nr:helix-turn-helix domain-containing protein [Bacillus cereus]